MTTPSTPALPADLPEVVTRYLAAHRDHDTAAAVAAFVPDATVTDDGSAYDGVAAIGEWLDRSSSGSAFTYTVRPVGAERIGADRWVVTQHLEGDFPGGTVDLHYRFALRGDLIERLVIEP
ncbi:nuclear transport factor 2 family protein [Streptomyces fuscigenes]|uniref:nuclear transport factor 2 family protein n=1 Tax=Streptomyces fuscigenes TaxID=1528880 RepID=UPI001F27A338|nr:nuclear transport factor 2 family protein [Streptomyces fuscigenes]MCF3964339.1 nuclear transport factor 2 family protein [Streptomyces fuscigenes]